MTRLIAAMGSVLLSGAFMFAQQPSDAPTPKSVQAKAAIAKAEKAEEAAKAAYRKALTDAKRTQLAELKAALAVATKAGNLEEANAIKQVVDRVAAELAALTGESEAVRVMANKEWTSVKLLAGTYRLTAKGRWMAGPGTPYCGPEGTGKPTAARKNLGVLQAKVNGKLVEVGAEATLTLEADGEVEFQIADGSFNDNSGEVIVNIVREVDLPAK